MKVQVRDCKADGTSTLRCVCELEECYPDDDEAFMIAFENIQRKGEHREGGGAAPLSIILKARPNQ